MNSNFRRYMLGLSLLVGVAAPWAATARAPISNVGSGSTDERLSQLERISDAHSQLLTQLQQQLSDSQRDIDTLRGQIQENQYQLNQIIERQKDLYLQLDKITNPSSAESSEPENRNAVSSAPAGNKQSAVSASTGSEKSDYDAAVSLAINTKEYDKAIVAFQNFAKTYPKSKYLPNANYWLGQLNYNKGKKDDAAYYFATVVKDYPKSQKSSDSLYKVGLIMQEKGQKDKAKAVYQQVVKQYPGTNAAKMAGKKLSGM
ncbi:MULTISPECIES: cell division protein CpoB [Xenorhabdus]|uniref:Cell division coordinator CpoB n=2 Tax=Morganellaceae TaxID=1903414 RepID=A0A2D0ITT0_9GAMM|nr:MULTISPECIES: cell division protein CpoB [Xenorhabdus]MBC8947848.1 cell division protein CpoB [Xenorhabdus sp. TS4]MBC8948750.1 cell division protein CpoB [Xenorhabdus sp. TS4]PHM25266.1 cell division protein CpoB [Xenorhabdus ehlersii]PHM26843.1 cell division protein CpoB [Xenorhabdus ehlersii]RKE90397.1 tol-pal system protein YbgF [Xenorhabdus ehlersii]